ncbi:restriction endonuclease subunit S [Hyphomicrobium sp. MC8b]|uniref:restriction endonuclease subunit S n=1 Tax=Hyphomicrobium sp. MC8b TaxID=300273 RepID=UPI00391A1F7C
MREMPQGWALATVNDTGEYLNGLAFKPSDWTSDGLPIIRIQNLTDRSKQLNRTPREVDARYLVNDGDILVSWSATLDAFVWDRGKAILNQHIFKVVPETRLVDRVFLFHGLRLAIREMIESEHLHGSTMKHINRGPFLAHPFPVPPLPEQRRMVARIDSLSAKSRRARDNLDHVPRLVEKYKRAILASAFRGDLTRAWRTKQHLVTSKDQLEAIRARTWQREREAGRVKGRYVSAESIDWQPSIELPSGWVWASVDQLSTIVQYGSSAKAGDNSAGVAVLRMGNIQSGKLDLTSLKFLPNDHDEFPALLLEDGDVLFNRTNSPELVGKSAVYCGEPKKASFASYLIRIRCCGLLPSLLSGYINSAYGRDWVASVVNQQVGQANVNGTKLRQLGVPVMPPDEQAEVTRLINIAFAWIDRLSHEAVSAHKLIDHLDQAVLAKAFRGELVPQDPTDEAANALLARIREEREVEPRGRRRLNALS